MRILVFALLWWIVSDGAASWAFGIPVVLLATLASRRLRPERGVRPRLVAGFAFAGFFMLHSLRAGVDVARRALGPRPLRLAPALMEYPLHLPAGPSRVFLVDVLSLLPGTLSTELRDDRLCLHVLDAGMPIEQELRIVERHVATLFGLSLQHGREEMEDH